MVPRVHVPVTAGHPAYELGRPNVIIESRFWSGKFHHVPKESDSKGKPKSEPAHQPQAPAIPSKDVKRSGSNTPEERRS